MKLAIDIRCLQDTWRTGVGEYTWQILKALVLQPSFKNILGYVAGIAAGEVNNDVKKTITLATSYYNPRLQNFLYTMGWGDSMDDILQSELNQKPDVWWLPNPTFCKLDKNIPLVLTVHDLAFIHYPEFFKLRGRLWYFPYITKLLGNINNFKKCSLVAVSEHTAQDIKDRFPNITAPITVIPPAVSDIYHHKLTTEIKTKVQKRYNIERPYLLCVSTIEPRKNYNLLLHVYELLLKRQPDFAYDLVIVGAWGWKNKDFKKILQQHNYRERIHVLGYVPEYDKSALYQEAALFLYPSYYEGFGIPVLEAMASGVAVLASNVSSLPDLLQDNGLLIDPRQIFEWVEGIEWLLTDSKACTNFVTRARIKASEYSWKKSAEEYSKLFHDLYEGSN